LFLFSRRLANKNFDSCKILFSFFDNSIKDDVPNMAVTVSKNELKMVLDKLDSVELEILRLRAMLLPEEEATAEEKKEIKQAKKEIRLRLG
jgi:hypothetical protein